MARPYATSTSRKPLLPRTASTGAAGHRRPKPRLRATRLVRSVTEPCGDPYQWRGGTSRTSFPERYLRDGNVVTACP